MKNLTTFLILLLVMVGCQTDPDDVSIQIPVMMAPSSTLEGNYQIKVNISGVGMGTITETVSVSVAIGQAQTQIVTISSVPVGKNRKIQIQILEGDKVVSAQSETVDLQDQSINSFAFQFESLIEDDKKEEVVSNPKKITWEKDGSEMVLIPSGSFEMGDHFSEGRVTERPVHEVTLDAFYMDIHEVTVGQFKKFVSETGYTYNRWNDVVKYSPADDYPMVYMTWNDAMAYCDWVGKRLPTEAEWEYAARGGLVGKRYPWGDEIDNFKANYMGDANFDGTTVVGSYPANGYGIYDMTGNVLEWCLDMYDPGFYHKGHNDPTVNPLAGHISVEAVFDNYERLESSLMVLRGGSWSLGGTWLRLASRLNGVDTNRNQIWEDNGFRCVSGVN